MNGRIAKAATASIGLDVHKNDQRSGNFDHGQNDVLRSMMHQFR
mgnify:CR=1 FL=1